MAKKRSPDSVLTKLEEMCIGDEIFVNKTSGYVGDAINTVCETYKKRKYKQITVYTHDKLEYKSLKDFHKIVCIQRIK